jgi:hypothetical protein
MKGTSEIFQGRIISEQRPWLSKALWDCSNGSNDPDAAHVSGRPWHHPYDAGFAGVQNARAVGSW